MEALLSDYEVLALLREQEEQRKKGGTQAVQPPNLMTIEFEVKKYLGESPAGYQATEEVGAALTALKPFKLTKAEKLQILNLRAATTVELHLLIEECEERFTEEEVLRLRSIVSSLLPALPAPADPSSAAARDGNGADEGDRESAPAAQSIESSKTRGSR